MTVMSKQAAVRIGGILAGAGVMFVGGALIVSGPAFADNGPHVTYQGTTTIGTGPDGCAGCHRIHSAAGEEFLFRSTTSESALCANCHGTAGTGATTDVMDGWSYTNTAASGPVAPLRAGGFNKAGIIGNDVTRYAAYDPSNDRLISKAANLIGAGGASGANFTATTSAHGIKTGQETGTMWGYSTAGAGVGGVTLECASCHNPHGNGNFRILKPVAFSGPTATGGSTPQSATTNNYFVNPSNVTGVVATAYTASDGTTKYNYTYTTSAAHNLRPGQNVAITAAATGGLSPAGYVKSGTVNSVPSNTTFVIGNQGTDPGAATGAGYVAQAFNNSIKSVTVNAANRTVTFTTFAAHGLTAPLNGDTSLSKQTTQYVSIAGAQSPAGAFNLSQVPVTAVGSSTTFTVTVPATTTMPVATDYTTGFSGGYIVGIPDSLNKNALGAIVYQQTNFWRADDHYYTGRQANTLGTSMVAVTAASYAAGVGTYTVSDSSSLAVGDLVTITGLYVSPVPAPPGSATSSGLNFTQAKVLSVPNATSFTASLSCTSNCGAATGTNQAGQQSGYLSPKTSSGFINNVSQWCSTCHTRYLAASSSRVLPNVTQAGEDSIFTYRHTSNSAGEDSPNCIQCHVAHGSNAAMTGTYSANLNNPGDPKTATTNPGTATVGDSRLLRSDNRGVCLLCHNM